MTATFFATPFVLAVGLSLLSAVVLLAVSQWIGDARPMKLSDIETALFHGFTNLFFAGLGAGFYVLTHWPFIPLLRRVREKPLTQKALAVIAISLYGAAIMVLAFAIPQWNIPYRNYRYDAPLGAGLSLVLTTAILLAAGWRARR